MTTMRDVARVAGVSAKTVSRVFNDDPHVAAETRDRVRWAMQKLNYVPNMLARSFRAGADAAVGVAIPDIADPFFAAMTASIEVDLGGRGMAVVVTSLRQGAEHERPALESLLRRQISGLIVAAVSPDQSYLAPWQDRTPVVFVDRAPRGLSGVYVIEDDLAGARAAVLHLASHGHRRVAFFDISAPVMTTRRRLKGYREAVAEAGLASRPRPRLHGRRVARRVRRRPGAAAGGPGLSHRRVLLERPLHDGARAGPAQGGPDRCRRGRVRRRAAGRGAVPGDHRHRPGPGRARAHRRRAAT